jgi:hypothetical protein
MSTSKWTRKPIPPLRTNSLIKAIFNARNSHESWYVLKNALDPHILQSQYVDNCMSPNDMKVALVILLTMVLNCIDEAELMLAKKILANLEVIPFSKDNMPYEDLLIAMLKKMRDDVEGDTIFGKHLCDMCVKVSDSDLTNDRCTCDNCKHHAYSGRDSVFVFDNGTYVCPHVQQKQASFNTLKALLSLVRTVANSRVYDPDCEEFRKELADFKNWYIFGALPSQFTPEKSSRYLMKVINVLTGLFGCKDVSWRHISLIYLMRKVLLDKAHVQIQPGGTTEGETEKCNVWLLIGVLQETYGQLLPPITSPAPPLSQ